MDLIERLRNFEGSDAALAAHQQGGSDNDHRLERQTND